MIKDTRDLIQILPFEKELRERLFNRYDSLSVGERYELESALWDAYDGLYQLKLEENYQLELIKVQQGTEALNKELFKKAQAKTEKDMQTDYHAKMANSDLEAVRAKLEAVINEHKPQDL